jgi:hypothetical protein
MTFDDDFMRHVNDENATFVHDNSTGNAAGQHVEKPPVPLVLVPDNLMEVKCCSKEGSFVSWSTGLHEFSCKLNVS